ncbi:hypothetical protein LCGC14_2716110 [marine sediment metagenome]|uniref:VRR-NUC domain-containing protein n=1 Tax=marine sediment metagenome TaxID=412755 RepID=A0A0F8ZZ41_9ZZZZ
MIKYSEFDLQKAVVQFLEIALPLEAVFFHVPNGEKRSKATAGKLKAMGVKPGVPDIFILYGSLTYFIELKRPKGGVASDDQNIMQERLRCAGAAVMMGNCRSVEELENWLTVFMPLRATVAA